MLRLLSIRNFVLVDALDIELESGFAVLTGETGAGKSILLDALALLLGDRFELRQLRPGADRAELAAQFDVVDAPGVRAWLAEQALVDDEGDVLVRRVLDAQGRSRAWANGRPVTLAQLRELGERLVDLHGQHAHASLESPDVQRALLDGFGGFATLTREVGEAWRAWRAAVERRDAAAQAAAASSVERERLTERRTELQSLGVSVSEWVDLAAAQSRLAHAASLIEAATQGEDLLNDGEDAIARRLAQLLQRLRTEAAHDPSLETVIELIEPAAIQLDEAARALRDYRRRLDLDPQELARVEERLSTIHQVARKYRVRPESLPGLLAETEMQLAALTESADAGRLAHRAADAESAYRSLASELSRKRRFAANELATRVTGTMQKLAMSGGRLDVVLPALATAASYGMESVELQVASHPNQPPGPLAKVASGGELSRIALAIQVVTSEVGQVPTLVFDEVDSGIGGGVAATVGALLQSLGRRRQVLCVTHLAQVAAFADVHYRVTKSGDGEAVTSELVRLTREERIEELSRMLGGTSITGKTRAHARELFEQHQRSNREALR